MAIRLAAKLAVLALAALVLLWAASLHGCA